MSFTERDRYGNSTVLTLLACMTVATCALTWLGYRSTREWVRTTEAAVQQRGNEVLALLATALSYDMKGAQISVLVPINQASLNLHPPHDLADRFARGLARFPYPESFFASETTGTSGESTFFFSRSDRPPRWWRGDTSAKLFPVLIDHDPEPMRGLVAHAKSLAINNVPFALFETDIGDTPYQVLVHFIYRDAGASTTLLGLVGFTVNLQWTRDNYFKALIAQIERIGGGQNIVGLEIVDEQGRVVAGESAIAFEHADQTRHFPLMFADGALFSSLPRPRPVSREWSVRVSLRNDPSLRAVGRSATRALWLLALVSILTIVALSMTVRAARDAAAFVAVRTAFVSSVSHEMKTPLSLIRLASDTLMKGRYSSQEKINEYARMLSFEADQLTRLVDNILSYVRIADGAGAHGRTLESLDVTELVEECLERFRPRLAELRIAVVLQLADDVPFVYADRGLLTSAIDNLIDNVTKYAALGQMLTLRIWIADRQVHIDVADRGPGIREDELQLVFQKFFRGQGVKERGSGLGLSIVKQVAEAHGGTVAIKSTLGDGTSVVLSLPIEKARTQG